MTEYDDDRVSGSPTGTDEPTRVLHMDEDEFTRVLHMDDDSIRAVHADDNDSTRVLHADDNDSTRVLGLADVESTRVLGPADAEPIRAPQSRPDDDEYSATVLASHWIQRPEPETVPVGPPTTNLVNLLEKSPPTPSTTSPASPAPPTLPDRTEGTVLRFGPGVTAAVANRTHSTLNVVPAPLAPPRRRLRRHALPALVLLVVIAFLAWQRLGPDIAARTVEVTARPTLLGCDATADIAARVTTNGRPGTLSYRWTRSDGTASGVLREEMVRGQKHANLHLLWTFQGKGRYTAQAELHLLSPTRRTVTTHFTYDCR
ncbi:hypothetical protein PV396_18090 [Streptomyces sp. ME02-8801-2C]|uniref:hypothetical protein n=1 Tax=Streptomyces sp. ME02-8801-2C TaxID=3028680 RepID=UPI0029A8391B|nr:hypothetical protein [Streptomyces sp. ME02-8801-2C]MDX3453833.1 hypothetical protein [Streptomyces sp. ME02-8801-2C]